MTIAPRFDAHAEVYRTVVFNTSTIDRPSVADLLRGARATFNLSGNTRGDYCFADTAMEADAAALMNDWLVVSSDYNSAFVEHAEARDR